MATAPATTGTRWRSVLVLEGVPTDDGRIIDPGALDWRDLPLTLMGLTETGPGGHEGAQVAGRIDTIKREGQEVIGEGVFDSGVYGQEIARMVTEESLRGVSVDLAIREFELRGEDGEAIAEDAALDMDATVMFAVTDGSIMGATVCPFPAFRDANIVIVADGGNRFARFEFGTIEILDDAPPLVAAAPVRPPAAWFENPDLDGPTALHVTEEGRVYGHAALFDTCHIADPHGAGVCVTAPRSRSGYSYFHLGAVTTAEGEQVAVGQITLAAPHAPLKANYREASAHYDDTGYAAADVRVGEDRFGIWVAGAVRPDVDEERVRQLSGAKLSGDWRGVRGSLELVGLLCVNVPGFPVPRVAARVASGVDERVALVAAGIVDEPVLSEQEFATRRKVLAARARGGVEALARLARGA